MASINYFLNLFLLEQSEFIYPRYKIQIYICFSYHLLTNDNYVLGTVMNRRFTLRLAKPG